MTAPASAAAIRSPLVAGNYIVHVDHAEGPDRHARLQPGQRGRLQERQRPRTGAIPGGGNGCLYRLVREEDVNVDLGNHFAPADPAAAVRRRRPRARPVDAGHAQPSTTATSDQPIAPLCDKKLVVLQNGQNANADFNMMTNFRTDPNGDGRQRHAHRRRRGARPRRRPGLQRHLLRDATSCPSGTASRGRSPDIPVGIYARVDTVTRAARIVNQRRIDPNTWRLITTVDHEPGWHVRGAAALDRDAQLPDPAGALPGHVHRHGRRSGHEGTPERQLQPEPADREHAGRGLAGPDRPSSTLPLDPISGTACEDPAGGTTPIRRIPPGPTCSRSRGRTCSRADTRRRPPDHDPRRLHRHHRHRDRRHRRAGHADRRRERARSTTLTRANGGIVSWTPGHRQHAGHDRHPGPGASTRADASGPGPKQLTIITRQRERRRVQRQRHHLHVLGSNGTGAQRRHLQPADRERGAAAAAGQRHASRPRSMAPRPAACSCSRPAPTTRTCSSGSRSSSRASARAASSAPTSSQGRDPEDPRFNVPGSDHRRPLLPAER